MKPIKALLSLFPGGKRLYEKRTRRRRAQHLARLGGAEDRFTHFYEVNKWNDAESRSGPGSTEAYTRSVRRALPELFARLGVRTFLDAPCGDYNWFRLVERGDVHYVGGDIVKPMVEANRKRYGDATTEFVHLDIVRDELPAADLWMCRDCLFHLSNADAVAAIRNFLDSGIPYLLTSTHPECRENTDIPTGSFRLLNLELPPFEFPPPEQSIDDWIEGFPVRHLALWERQALTSVRRESR